MHSKRYKIYLTVSILSFFFLIGNFLSSNRIFAKTIDEEINEIGKQIEQIEKSLDPLKKETTSLQTKISQSKSQIQKTETQINSLGQKIIDKESDLEVQKLLLAQRVKRYYINTKKLNPFVIFLSSAESSTLLHQYTWYQSVMTKDRQMITSFVEDIKKLTDNKANLEKEKKKLANLKVDMEKRFGFLNTEIKKAEDYKKQLSAKQQTLIAEKNAMFNTSVGDVSSSDDPASRSDYNPGFSPLSVAILTLFVEPPVE